MNLQAFPVTARPRALTWAALCAAAALSACTHMEYRCPLDASGKPQAATACTSMKEALAGAKQGTGGKTSVMMDDQGRLVPRELLDGRPALPLAGTGSAEPYVQPSGTPVYEQPRVFQTWTGAYQDANGNLHDGRTSWFATPGRWSYGTVSQPNAAAEGSSMLGPARPGELPSGRIVSEGKNGVSSGPVTNGPVSAAPKPATAAPAASAASGAKAPDAQAGQALNAVANNAASKQAVRATGGDPRVTSPALKLGD